jgi:glucose-fructose oxidoreductase
MTTKRNGHDGVKRDGPVRYAVVGQGWIAQTAVLPAFDHAKRNSRLVALVSGDPRKRAALARRYHVKAYGYDDYERLVSSGEVDAVYLAVPNAQHKDFAVRAARRGVHVLCEKPLAVDERDCQVMIDACRKGGVRLMTAYRLHFEKATLKALEVVRQGAIGEPKLFVSSFTMQVEEGNYRKSGPDQGGGAFYDIGVYCINAARHLFEAEPVEVFATTVGGRAGHAEDSGSAILRFPGDRLATFCVSFGSDKTSEYRVVGTKGSLRAEPGYAHAKGLELFLETSGGEKHLAFKQRDQFAPELVHFSDCIREGQEPEPTGEEGLADVRVIRALYASAARGRPVRLAPRRTTKRPSRKNVHDRPPPREPKLIGAAPPGG